MPSLRSTAEAEFPLTRVVIALVLAFVLTSAGAAHAGDSLPELVPFRLTVNDVPLGAVEIYLGSANVRIRSSDLIKAGVASSAFVAASDGFVALAPLAPKITYRLDLDTVTLELLVDPTLLVADSRFGSAQGDGQSVARPIDGGFLNYALTSSFSNKPTILSEIGVAVPRGGVFLSSLQVAPGVGFQRDATSLTFDSPNRNRRVVIGDAASSAGPLGGSPYLEGVSIGRNFGLNPNFVQYPEPDFAGTVVTPSTVDVYVNGTLYSHQFVQPGKFEITDVPVGSGLSNTRVVITDAFGHAQSFAGSFYENQVVLRKGLSDYSYSAGRRFSPGASGGGFNEIGRYTLGVTNNFTAGARFENGPGFTSVGTSSAFTLPLGTLAIAEGLSRAGGGTSGAAASLDYSVALDRYSFALSYLRQSPFYVNSSLLADQDRSLSRVGTSVSTRFARTNFTLGFEGQAFRDRGPSRSFSLGLNRRFGNNLEAYTDFSRLTNSSVTGSSFSVGVRYFRGSTFASTSITSGAGGAGLDTTLAHVPAQGGGLGYLVSDDRGSASRSNAASVSYLSRTGFYSFGTTTQGGSTSKQLDISGGFVASSKGLFATRAIDESYVIVDTSGVPGIRTSYGNQILAVTNRHGYAVITDVAPYSIDDIRIRNSDVPAGFSIDRTDAPVRPAYRSGALARFTIEARRAITGSVNFSSGAAPAYGLITLRGAGKSRTSELDSDAEFYVEDIVAGTYDATVISHGSTCTFRIDVPNRKTVLIDLGKLSCTPAKS